MPTKRTRIARTTTALPLYDCQVSYVTTSHQRSQVDDLASEMGVSRAAILRDVVTLGLKAYRRKLA